MTDSPARQALFHAGHADQDDPDSSAVEHVPNKFERRHREALGFVQNQHFDPALIFDDQAILFIITIQMIFDADLDPHHKLTQRPAHVT
jgi:hypothetical protein